jgi:hypothetical protein
MESAPVADLPIDTAAGPAPAGVCPFPHEALKKVVPSAAEACPVRPAANQAPVNRSDADMFVRRLLRISDKPRQVSEAAAQKSFQRSMFISAVRCTLTYVIFPFVAPAIGFATGVGPVVGLIIGSIAIVCDVFTVRRFFAADHKWRWHFSAIAVSIICLLMVLLVQDVSHIVGRLTS